MLVFDLKSVQAHPYADRDKNVFYQAPEFKARLIQLPPGGAMPLCEMSSYVVFMVVAGEAEVQVGSEVATIREGQCLITEPATLSMRTVEGVKMMGLQIVPKKFELPEMV